MYNSLRLHMSDFHIYIFAFDDLCLRILKSLSLQNTTIISQKEFENDDLLNVKKTRTRAEYFWTCTSSAIEYVLTNYTVQVCTYLDADLFFYTSPSVLLDELSDKGSILITEHRYSRLSSIYEQKRAGRFCVQFITFKNTHDSRKVLDAWKDQCIKWCYNRYEDGKFGDQKYLDEWPAKYPNIHILNNLGGGVAPWNVGQYKIFRKNDYLYGIQRKTGNKFDLIFFHFHFVRFLNEKTVDVGWNFLGQHIKENIYYPYIQRLIETERILTEVDRDYRIQLNYSTTFTIRETIKVILKKISGYNLINISKTQNGLYYKSEDIY